MNKDLTWSLKELYEEFDSEKFQDDLRQLGSEIAKLNTWTAENFTNFDEPTKKLETFISMQNSFSKFTKLLHFSSLKLSANAKDFEALKYKEKLLNMYSEIVSSSFLFENFLKNIENLDELIENSLPLKEHSFVLKEAKKNSEFLLDKQTEEVIAKLRLTGSNAWENQRDYLTSMLLVDMEIDGTTKEVPLALVRNYAYDEDKDLRKRAYEAELKAYKKIDSSLCFSLNNIKGEVISLSKQRGYESPLDMTLINSRMDKKTLEALLSSMENHLDIFRKFINKKAELLGHKNGLPFYDLFAPIGDISLSFTYEEAKNYIISNFTKFSKNLGGYAKKAFDKNWIDVLPRKGKQGGAFCSNIHVLGESRILTNFTGSFSDVLTLAHELGHGYHGQCLSKETYLNSKYPMPIAETASTMCETIVINAALKDATNDEKLVILENDLTGITQVIVDIYSRFLFEHELFKRKENGFVSVEELNEMMQDAQKKAYGQALDHKYLHPYMWAVKSHYYYASRNYYNFPYAFGQLFSKGLYALYLKDGDSFVEKYDIILKATGSNNLTDVAKLASIDITTKEFWDSSLKIIEKDVNEFIK